jgi:hypothetical protein
MANDILITGLPRAGTTLVVSLLNRLDDVVALHEPIEFMGRPFDRARIYEATIAPYLAATREQILVTRRVRTRITGAEQDDNPYGTDRNDAGLRTSRARLGWISVDKPLSADFLLAAKHPMAFTAVLDRLVGRIPVYAMVRNPLALLGSWASVEGGFNRGRIPVAELLNTEIRQRLAGIDDVIDRQLTILDWMFSQYARYLSREKIITYEELVRSRGSALGVIAPRAVTLALGLESRNDNALYDPVAMLKAANRLMSASGAMWDFYSLADVRALAEQIADRMP